MLGLVTCVFAEHMDTDILYTQHGHMYPTSHMVQEQLLCYKSTDTDVSIMLMGVQMLSVYHPVAPSLPCSPYTEGEERVGADKC